MMAMQSVCRVRVGGWVDVGGGGAGPGSLTSWDGWRALCGFAAPGLPPALCVRLGQVRRFAAGHAVLSASLH